MFAFVADFCLFIYFNMDWEIKCVYPRRVCVDMIPALPLVKYEGEIELVENESQLAKTYLASTPKHGQTLIGESLIRFPYCSLRERKKSG